MELRFAAGSRAKTIAIVTLAVMALFVARLFWIQVVQHERYVAQADSEQIKQMTLYPSRGEIYLMDGDTPRKAVMNERVYTVWADPTQVKDKAAVTEALNKIAGGNVRANFAQYLDTPNSRYQVLATKVTRTQAELLKKENLAGIGFDAVTQRTYPEGELAAQVLGFVNTEGKGVYGIEQANDARLKGENGLLKTVTDVRDVPLTIGDKNIRQPAVDGDNLVLTIDRNIQAKTEQALVDGLERTGAKKASALVMDPNTGAVLAMANVPTFNPGETGKVTDYSVFNNETISNPYEPGSVMKTVMMATGIDQGVMSPSSTYNNTDSIKIGDVPPIQNASKGKTGVISMQDVLDWSLNTGTVTIAQWLGDGTISRKARDTMYTYYHDKFRLGEKTDIELANEQGGVVIPPTEVQGNAVRYANMTFGQGLDVTTLQMASAFSAVINGGVYRQPSIIAGTLAEDGTIKKAPAKVSEQIIKPSTSSQMREMIYGARHAFALRNPDTAGYYVGGKTSTAQTIVDGTYSFEQTVGAYLGFGGEIGGMPQYVVMVEISGPDMNLQGAHHAGPIFTDISNWMINYLKLTPKG